jgi:hypothetical protein
MNRLAGVLRIVDDDDRGAPHRRCQIGATGRVGTLGSRLDDSGRKSRTHRPLDLRPASWGPEARCSRLAAKVGKVRWRRANTSPPRLRRLRPPEGTAPTRAVSRAGTSCNLRAAPSFPSGCRPARRGPPRPLRRRLSRYRRHRHGADGAHGPRSARRPAGQRPHGRLPRAGQSRHSPPRRRISSRRWIRTSIRSASRVSAKLRWSAWRPRSPMRCHGQADADPADPDRRCAVRLARKSGRSKPRSSPLGWRPSRTHGCARLDLS